MSGNINATGRCLSSGEMMAWLAEHMGEMGEQIRGEMSGAEHRVELMNDLSDLKAKLGDNSIDKYAEKLAMVDEFLAKYGNDPMAKELMNSLTSAREALNAAAKNTDQEATWNLYDKVVGAIGGLCSQAQAKIDALAKEDQIGMIRLQDATARGNQAMQMVSAVLASENGAAMSVIGNIRG